MTQHEEVTRLYAVVEQRTAEADEAYVEYERQVAATAAAYDAYLEKTVAEREARQVWMAAGDTIYAA